MSDIQISVGGAFEAEATSRFADAWKRADAGKILTEQHLAFESWDALARVLTTKRLALLRHLHRTPMASVPALAKALGRDCSNVHADVRALTDAGLIDVTNGEVRAEFNAIETRIAL